MMDYHTRESEQRCFSLIKTDLQDIWEDIGAMPDDTDADKWKKKLLKMAEEYVFPAVLP